jgi:P pilus assembly chaperone PapD
MDGRYDGKRRLVRRTVFGSGAPRGALLLLLLSVPAAASPPAVSIGIVPPYVEKVVPEASEVSDSIAFSNQGTDPVLVSVDLADFAVDKAGEVSEEPPGSQPASLVPFLRISPSSVRVAPHQQVFFRYSAETPPAFKQLRAMIYFSSRPEVPARPNQVLVVARMGVPIYVESRDAKPASLRIDDVKWERSGENLDFLTVKLTASNEGERNIRPAGFVLVRSSDGKFDRSYTFNEGREPVLPGQKRRWELSFGPVPAGDCAVKMRFAASPRSSYESKTWIPAIGG